MYTIFYKRFIDYYVIFEICLMASKSARMRGSAHLKAVTVAHQKSYVIPESCTDMMSRSEPKGFPLEETGKTRNLV